MKRRKSSGPVWRAPRIGDQFTVLETGRTGRVVGTRLAAGTVLVAWNGEPPTDPAPRIRISDIDYLTPAADQAAAHQARVAAEAAAEVERKHRQNATHLGRQEAYASAANLLESVLTERVVDAARLREILGTLRTRAEAEGYAAKSIKRELEGS